MFPNIDHTAVEALLKGQQCANSLKMLLENQEISSDSAEPLINTIRDSFSLALSSIESPNPPPHHHSSQTMASPVPERSSRKKIYGCEGLENYRDDSPTPLSDDGFNWRKYGQKNIKASPHQRCYYRCTSSKDRNCDAKKRVQKINDNPPVFRTTYLGQHVCKAPSFAVNDENCPGMMQSDHTVSESVMPQIALTDHQAITMEDGATNHIMNQECDINDSFMNDDQFWQNEIFFSGDTMFLDIDASFD